MKKAVAKDYEAYSKKILKICVDKSVSLEAFAYDHSSKKNRALKINNWKKNVFVKLPITNPKGVSTGKLIKELDNKEIKLNITTVYNFKQTPKNLN